MFQGMGSFLAGARGSQMTIDDFFSEANSQGEVIRTNGEPLIAGGQSFISGGGKLVACKFLLKKYEGGAPTGNCWAKLFASTGTHGVNATGTGTALATSDTVDVSTLPSDDALFTFNFTEANQYVMTLGTVYVIVFEYPAGFTPNYVYIIGERGLLDDGNSSQYDSVGTWTTQSIDICFYVYVIPPVISIDEFYSETNQDNAFVLSSDPINVLAVGQTFLSNGGTLASAKFYLFRSGSPTGNIVARLYTSTGTYGSTAIPTGSGPGSGFLAVSDTIDVTTIGVFPYALVTFNFTGVNQYILSNGTVYCIDVEYSGGDISNYIQIGDNETTPTHSGNNFFFQGGVWQTFPGDTCFYVYVARTGRRTVVDDFYSEANSSGSVGGIDGDVGDAKGIGQSFTSTGGTLVSAQFYVQKHGSPTGNMVAKLFASTGTFGTNAKPTGAALAISDNFDVSTLSSSSLELKTLNFSSANYLMITGTVYCIMLEYTGGDASNVVWMGVDDTSPTHSGNAFTENPVGTFAAPYFGSPDFIFYVNKSI